MKEPMDAVRGDLGMGKKWSIATQMIASGQEFARDL
jgi:hypothetical protein